MPHGGQAKYQVCRYPAFHQINNQAGIDTCLFAIFDADDGEHPMEGVFDLATGDMFLDHNKATVGVQFFGCQTCQSDTTPNDGNKNGTCFIEDRDTGLPIDTGVPCDVHVQSNQPGLTYSLSYDCHIQDLNDPSQLGYALFDIPNVRRKVTSTAKELVLDDNFPNCGAAGRENEKCFCGVCEGTAVPCMSDAECDPGVDCVAGMRPTVPNSCVDTCAFDATADWFRCSDGSQMINCFPTDVPLPIPGSNENMGAFYSVTIADVSCVGPTGSQADGALGFPGLLLNVEALRITKVFAP